MLKQRNIANEENHPKKKTAMATCAAKHVPHLGEKEGKQLTRLEKLKENSGDAATQATLDEAMAQIQATRASLAKTQKTLDNAREQSAKILEQSASIEERWAEFQRAFDEMNKKMVENIAASLGGTHISRTGIKHERIPAKDCVSMIKNAKSIVVMTGAGISVDSGIPTYRGSDGYWTKGSNNYRAQEVATRRFFREKPEEQWEYMFERYQNMSTAKPNPGHHSLVALEQYCKQNKKSFCLISQNIDNLHRRSGSQNICEIHGNMSFARCSNSDCHEWEKCVKFPTPPKKGNDKYVPKCKACSANLRPNVLFFDESYSEKLYKLKSAIAAVEKADVFLVIGTTYQTNLPLRLLNIANTSGAKIIDINPNLNDDVAVCKLKQVKETSTEFLEKTMDALLKKSGVNGRRRRKK